MSRNEADETGMVRRKQGEKRNKLLCERHGGTGGTGGTGALSVAWRNRRNRSPVGGMEEQEEQEPCWWHGGLWRETRPYSAVFASTGPDVLVEQP